MKKMTYGVQGSRRGRERDGVAGAFWAMQKYCGLLVGPKESKTQNMAWFELLVNCNGMFSNRRIVMAYL